MQHMRNPDKKFSLNHLADNIPS